VRPNLRGILAADHEMPGVAGTLAVDKDYHLIAGLRARDGADLFEIDYEPSDSYKIRQWGSPFVLWEAVRRCRLAGGLARRV